MTPERELGKGPCEVYAWCLPLYQQCSDGRWPIKIGWAGTDGFRRRLRDFRENLPERPRYLLRIGCADETEARDRESVLHAWFRARKRKIDDLPGEEWFLTNPGEIEVAIRMIMVNDESTGGVSAPEIEDEITEAFKGVTAKDWGSLPADLTDKLDHYLYGSDEP